MNHKYDVIIVGAGYAGLTAAELLHNAGKDILVLEARDRVGGRVYTKYIDNETYLDLGAAWVGPTQDHFYETIRNNGCETFKTYDKGLSKMWINDKVKSYKGLIPPLPIFALLSLDFAIKKLNKLSKAIDLNKPWTSEKAKKYDGMTLQTWMNQNMNSKKARLMFKIAAEAIWAADPAEISFLHALFYIKSGQNLDVLMNVAGGAQEERIKGGAQKPALKIAEKLSEKIKLIAPVSSILQANNELEITVKGQKFYAKKVIMSIPPPMISKIKFEPALSSTKISLLQRMPMGAVVKTFAIYDKPFWREEGLNGLAAAGHGYTSVVFDNSPDDASKGILMGFVLANNAKAFLELSAEERKNSILDSFETLFGTEAKNIQAYEEQSWVNEEFSGGCYAAYMVPGAWTSLGHVLREPSGHIHWAGTETATHWNGYIDGAISSGKRVANEILEII